MSVMAPVTALDVDYSSEQAQATSWDVARERLADAELYWVTTVRPDGRPHVTPLIGVWHDEALHFCTGPTERKARNLETNQACVLTTGCNALAEGLDLVVEGEAERVEDEVELGRVAEVYEAKYGSDWHFDVADGMFEQAGHRALVFRVAPVTAFGFAKGAYGQTRWQFPAAR